MHVGLRVQGLGLRKLGASFELSSNRVLLFFFEGPFPRVQGLGLLLKAFELLCLSFFQVIGLGGLFRFQGF